MSLRPSQVHTEKPYLNKQTNKVICRGVKVKGAWCLGEVMEGASDMGQNPQRFNVKSQCLRPAGSLNPHLLQGYLWAQQTECGAVLDLHTPRDEVRP